MTVIRVNGSSTSNFPTGGDVSAEIDLSVHDIGELRDVNTTGVANNSILKYDSGTSKFIIATDTDTGISNVVEDTTPQLGGDLDLNSNNITGSGDISTTGNVAITGGSAGNNQIEVSTNSNYASTLQIGKRDNSARTNRNTTVYFKTDDGTSEYFQIMLATRRNSSSDKHITINSLNDAGTSFTQLAKFSDSIIDLDVDTAVNGQLTINADGSTDPNSANMYTTMDVADLLHNYLTSINDYGASTIPDGSALAHSFKVEDDTQGDLFVGRLFFQYDSSGINNNLATIQSMNDDGSNVERIGVGQYQSFSDVPFNLPSYAVAGLPTSNISAGSMAYCTDETGGAVPVFYDGTDWRRVTDRAVAS